MTWFCRRCASRHTTHITPWETSFFHGFKYQETATRRPLKLRVQFDLKLLSCSEETPAGLLDEFNDQFNFNWRLAGKFCRANSDTRVTTRVPKYGHEQI